MTNFQIHPREELGLFKPLHGVNNGPIAYGSVNISRFVGLHDTN